MIQIIIVDEWVLPQWFQYLLIEKKNQKKYDAMYGSFS
jgi:hypothetical protein